MTWGSQIGLRSTVLHEPVGREDLVYVPRGDAGRWRTPRTSLAAGTRRGRVVLVFIVSDGPGAPFRSQGPSPRSARPVTGVTRGPATPVPDTGLSTVGWAGRVLEPVSRRGRRSTLGPVSTGVHLRRGECRPPWLSSGVVTGGVEGVVPVETLVEDETVGDATQEVGWDPGGSGSLGPWHCLGHTRPRSSHVEVWVRGSKGCVAVKDGERFRRRGCHPR